MSKQPVTNEEIVNEFKKALAVMEVENANPFRIRAYQNAVAAIQGLDEQLSIITKRGTLNNIPAIGPDLAGKITELLETGQVKEWQKLYKHVPAGMFALLDIPAIGPKRAYQLAKAFELNDPTTALNDLETAALEGDVKKLEGFGEKLEMEILENIRRPKPKTTRMRLDEGIAIADQVLTILRDIPEVDKASVLGSIRRREETVGDVDIAVATNKPEAVTSALAKHTDRIISFEAAGNNVIRLLLAGNKQADIKFQTPDKFGATLQHFTGSKFHNIALRELALSQGKSLSEHGIKENGDLKSFTTEAAFYAHLGLSYIEPELRQNDGEIEAAQKHTLPKLVTPSDIKGDFHTHTDFNWVSSHDYGSQVSDLLNSASDLGYEWLAMGDHNPSQTTYTPDQMVTLVQQRNDWLDRQVNEWHRQTGRTMHTFKTLEVDILPNGSLAMPDAALDQLDFVIVSLHSRLIMTEKQQTERILTALSHPKVKIFGHPTGRLIGDRQGVQADWPAIFETCLKRRIAIEINAHPTRLDLPDTLAKQAIRAQLRLTINTDAHDAGQLSLMHFGVGVARRAWAETRDIINTYTFDQVRKWLAE